MAEEKRIPELRFPDFEGEWETRRLGNLGQYLGGGTPETSVEEYWQGDIPWISSSDISDEGIHEIKKTRFITKEAISNSATKLVPKGAILMVSRVGIGKFAVADEDLCTSQDFTNLVTHENEYFLGQYFKARSKRFIRLSQGTSIKGFTTGDIKSAKFLIPKTEEQQKIASFLAAVDERIRLLQNQKEKLERYKKGVMQQIFRQEIRFKQDDGSDYPDWEERKLGELCAISKGQQLNKIELNETGEYPCQNGGIEPSGFTDKYNTEEDTITISEGGNSCGYVNYMESKFWCGGHCYALIEIRDSVTLSFLYQILKYNQHDIMRLRVGSGLPNIQKRDIVNFKIGIPSTQEQQKIAALLSALDEEINGTAKAVEATQKFKKGLLQKMFV
ncbi:MAG: restriction endonuclease subunit S [Owenweeksia sp.]|nr:restriction endonuclease subunit S [Owenweeksia sp.]MBF98177.1 restriction endonuclease subunit S [Owenweeksia sp.]HBF22076.1 restriction endonuclease subunit S [Cryomorphaceae bacterium]|tara:strand:+ start:770 stop:1933 length:1164 start_codon:yes stop_codon:yes gene_type:complete